MTDVSKFLQKIETYFCLKAFHYEKSRCQEDNVEEYGSAGQATDGNIMDN
jgi:hypothetical protein